MKIAQAHLFVRSAFILGCLTGCSLFVDPVKTTPLDSGPYGCGMPTQSVALNKNQIEIASAKVGDFALGKVDYKSQPELANVMSGASRDSLLVDYLVCIASGRGDVTTQAQKNHLRSRLDFMRSTPPPTADNLDNWDKMHPFPKE